MENKMKKMKKMNYDMPVMGVELAEMVMNIPVGGCFDMLHAEFINGQYGDVIVNGGLPPYTVIIGSVNNYKSTLAHNLIMSAVNKILLSELPTIVEALDTEMSMKETRLIQLSKTVGKLVTDFITDQHWRVTNPTVNSTNDWVQRFDDYVAEKSKNKNIDIEFECFYNAAKDKKVINKIPTFLEVDTISKFTNDKALDKLNDNDLDSSDTNTVFLNIGMFRKKFLMPLPRNLTKGNIYCVMTAHVAEKIEMASGPAKYIQPSKQLQYLRGGDNIEGGTKELKQAPNLMLQAHTARSLDIKKTGGKKEAKYPKDENDKTETDLNVILVTVLRNKSGMSGITIPVVVSQSEGVKFELTQFNFLKEVGDFGIEGNNINYNMTLYPEAKLSRTKVRKKIDTDHKLKRAIEITSDLFQMLMTRSEYMSNKFMVTPKDLYNRIKEMGYDWNVLLETRGYWLIDNYNLDIDKPPLSTPDILNIYLEEYHPWWYPKDGIKNKWLKD